MIETFKFRTETATKTYYHTVYSVDLKTAVEKWVTQIEHLQSEVYSFTASQVKNIKEQYLNERLKIHLDNEPFFLVYQDRDEHQVVHIEKLNKGNPDFIALVTYLTTEQGGRKGYAASGYRPQVKFDGRKELTSGEQIFIDKEKVLPGETVKSEIRIIGRDFFRNYLFVGQHFEVAEGSHLVGHGKILQVINPDLLQPNQ